MAKITSQKIIPHLWFAKDALEAVKRYVSLFPDSRVDGVTPVPSDTPSGPAGSVQVIEFTLAGQRFMALEAGPLDPFNHAISFLVECADQREVDRLWDALTEGGSEEPCGWLKDRYGLSWQIVPAALGEMIKDSDGDRSRRVLDAMFRMKKIDVAALERAYGEKPRRRVAGAGTAARSRRFKAPAAARTRRRK